MKLLVVRYTRERGQSDAEQAENMLHAAPNIAALPGLVWKVWTYNDAEHAAGGVYLFDTEEHARAWGDGTVQAALSQMPGIGDVQTNYYDIDSQLSAITRAPLAVAQPA
jgi:Putative mono-oxygenase ydhR